MPPRLRSRLRRAFRLRLRRAALFLRSYTFSRELLLFSIASRKCLARAPFGWDVAGRRRSGKRNERFLPGGARLTATDSPIRWRISVSNQSPDPINSAAILEIASRATRRTRQRRLVTRSKENRPRRFPKDIHIPSVVQHFFRSVTPGGICASCFLFFSDAICHVREATERTVATFWCRSAVQVEARPCADISRRADAVAGARCRLRMKNPIKQSRARGLPGYA